MRAGLAGLAEAIGVAGFVVVADVIAPDLVAGLIEALGRVEAGAGADRLIGRAGRTYAIRDLLRLAPEVRALADSPPLRALVEPVLGPGAFPVRGLLFDKTPGANWPVPWHQDATIAVRHKVEAPGFGPWSIKAGVPHVRPPAPVLDRMLTLRVHLDDCGPSNGPLRVVPGSHADGVLDADAIRAWLDRVAAVACPVGPGGVLAMRPLILHASSPATHPGHRRVIHLEYAADPLPDGLEWSEAEPGPRLAGRSW